MAPNNTAAGTFLRHERRCRSSKYSADELMNFLSSTKSAFQENRARHGRFQVICRCWAHASVWACNEIYTLAYKMNACVPRNASLVERTGRTGSSSSSNPWIPSHTIRSPSGYFKGLLAYSRLHVLESRPGTRKSLFGDPNPWNPGNWHTWSFGEDEAEIQCRPSGVAHGPPNGSHFKLQIFSIPVFVEAGRQTPSFSLSFLTPSVEPFLSQHNYLNNGLMPYKDTARGRTFKRLRPPFALALLRLGPKMLVLCSSS